MLVSTETCPQCGGSGWKTIPATAAKPQSVTRCDCRIGNWAERLLKKARIPARYQHCTLTNFEVDERVHPSLKTARLRAERFIEDYPVNTTGPLFIGPVGVGTLRSPWVWVGCCGATVRYHESRAALRPRCQSWFRRIFGHGLNKSRRRDKS